MFIKAALFMRVIKIGALQACEYFKSRNLQWLVRKAGILMLALLYREVHHTTEKLSTHLIQELLTYLLTH